MSMNDTTNASLDLIRKSQASPVDLAKSTFSQSASATSGLTFYDLEPGAKLLYPVLTPLRNIIPRVSGKGGIQASWRAVTAINSTNVGAGLGAGNRGGVIPVTTADYIAAYRGLGLESNVDFEADYAARGFDDVKALAVQSLLESLMIQEEHTILGGNASLALGTCPTPSVTGSTSGGTVSTGTTLSVKCVALTYEGYYRSSIANGVPGQITRTNADASTDTFGGGTSQVSAAGTGTVGSSAGSATATVTAVKGAVAYAWYWGASGSEKIGAITTINSVSITADAAGTQTPAAAGSFSGLASDYSRNTLIFDGLISQICTSGSNAYYKALATGTAGVGTPLTSNGAGGISEIDAALKSFWDNYRLSPDTIWVSSQEQGNISAKVLATTSGNPGAQRFVFSADQSKVGGGVMVTSYRNPYSMDGAKEIPIKLHPTLPPGTIIFTTNRLPYPMSNVANVVQVRTRQEYYQIEWPLRSRKYEYGVYCDEVLQNYAPFAFGVITNIANG